VAVIIFTIHLVALTSDSNADEKSARVIKRAWNCCVPIFPKQLKTVLFIDDFIFHQASAREM
jgi:hypothetical protein